MEKEIKDKEQYEILKKLNDKLVKFNKENKKNSKENGQRKKEDDKGDER